MTTPQVPTTPPQGIVLRGNRIANDAPLTLIAGPCVMESRDHAMFMAETIASIAARRNIGAIFKASFDKANRTSIHSTRGMGLDEALPVFAEISDQFGLATTTDVHAPEQCARAAEAVSILQIPAFLSRQTDLLIAAGETNAVVNIKKGQFMAPGDVLHAVAKVHATGNQQVMVTERGTSFGYHTLINDMRGLVEMGAQGTPVIFDATHSVQRPGGLGDRSGGDRTMVPVLARAAVAVGIAGLFVETHDNPDHAPSDGANMIPIHELDALIQTVQAIDSVIKNNTPR